MKQITRSLVQPWYGAARKHLSPVRRARTIKDRAIHFKRKKLHSEEGSEEQPRKKSKGTKSACAECVGTACPSRGGVGLAKGGSVQCLGDALEGAESTGRGFVRVDGTVNLRLA